MNRLRRLCIIAVMTLSILIAVNAEAKTLEVCSSGCPYSKIQSAIDDAVNGDKVLVKNGTYNESINYNDKIIAVHSANGAENTVINGGVTMLEGQGYETSLTGFTVQNSTKWGIKIRGTAAIWNCRIIATQNGPGIDITGGSPMIVNCTIANNSARSGAGIYIKGGNVKMLKVTIKNNRSPPGGQGGAILCSGVTQLIASMITVDGNTGGGIKLIKSTAFFNDSKILNNTSSNFGGGISCLDSSLTITRSIVSENSSDLSGGGIFSSGNSSVEIDNCTVTSNSASKLGGGIYLNNEPGKGSHISNTTVSRNTATQYGVGIHHGGHSHLTVVNTIVWGNYHSSGTYGLFSAVLSGTPSAKVMYSCIDKEQNVMLNATDLDIDPMFVNPASDYHLKENSPCIDKGTSDTSIHPAVIYRDIDYDTRPQGAGIDIGSDEFSGGQ